MTVKDNAASRHTIFLISSLRIYLSTPGNIWLEILLTNNFMEVEIAPGIYLSKRPADQAADRTKHLQQQAIAALKSNPHKYYEYLVNEKAAMNRQIELLKYSNQEMRNAESDPVFESAIKENIAILARNEAKMKDLTLEIKNLGMQLGIPQKLNAKIEIPEPSGDAEGVYL